MLVLYISYSNCLFTFLDETIFNISFELEVSFQGDNTQSLAFIKKVPESVLVADSNPSKQLQLVDLGSGSPFETLHAYVHNTFAPFFRSYIKSHSTGNKDSRLGLYYFFFNYFYYFF